MSDNDQLTDEPELRLLRDSLSGVALPKRPRPEAITVMGRTAPAAATSPESRACRSPASPQPPERPWD